MNTAFELIALLAGFTAWLGVCYLPAQAVAFSLGSRPTTPRHAGARGGLRLLSLRPGRAALVGLRLPFVVREAGLVPRVAPPRWLGLGAPTLAEPPLLAWAELESAEARGALLRVAGRQVLRGPPGSLRHLAVLLRALGAAPAAERAERLREEFDRSLAAATWAERIEQIRLETGPLGFVCDAYALLLFAGGPLLVWAYGEESGLGRLLVAVAPLHAATLLLAWQAHRGLRPGADGERLELLVTAALFPPNLLRVRQQLVDLVLEAPHPAALGAHRLSPERLRELLARQLTQLELDLEESAPGAARAALERERYAFARFVAGSDIELAALRRAPAPGDPTAQSYCPLCGEDYTLPEAFCSDCGVATLPYRTEA